MFEPTANGTRLSAKGNVTLAGPLKLMETMFAPKIRKLIHDTAPNLKRILESEMNVTRISVFALIIGTLGLVVGACGPGPTPTTVPSPAPTAAAAAVQPAQGGAAAVEPEAARRHVFGCATHDD